MSGGPSGAAAAAEGEALGAHCPGGLSAQGTRAPRGADEGRGDKGRSWRRHEVVRVSCSRRLVRGSEAGRNPVTGGRRDGLSLRGVWPSAPAEAARLLYVCRFRPVPAERP